LRSLQIASLGVVNVEILVLGIGENGGEILIGSASTQLNLLDGLLGLFQRDRWQRCVTFLQVVDVDGESISFGPRQLVESPLTNRRQVNWQIPKPVAQTIECGQSALEDLQGNAVVILVLSSGGEEARVVGRQRRHTDPSGECEAQWTFGDLIGAEAIHVFFAQ